MKMIKKIYNRVFAPPTSVDLAMTELESAKKAFLEAKTHTEYYAAQVEFESMRIQRLEEYVRGIAATTDLTVAVPQPVAESVAAPVKAVATAKPATKNKMLLTATKTPVRKTSVRKTSVQAKPVTRKTAALTKKVARKPAK